MDKQATYVNLQLSLDPFSNVGQTLEHCAATTTMVRCEFTVYHVCRLVDATVSLDG